jgi:hypothetical protein
MSYALYVHYGNHGRPLRALRERLAESDSQPYRRCDMKKVIVHPQHSAMTYQSAIDRVRMKYYLRYIANEPEYMKAWNLCRYSIWGMWDDALHGNYAT